MDSSEDKGRMRFEVEMPSFRDIHDRLNEQDRVLSRIDENVDLFRKEILGNGQPGRLTKLETRLEEHSGQINSWRGAIAIIAFFLLFVGGAEAWHILHAAPAQQIQGSH